MIIQNSIKINEKKIVSVHWMNSGNLLLSDSLQNVYIVGLEGKKCQLILSNDFDVEFLNNFLILPYMNSFFIVDNDSKLSVSNQVRLRLTKIRLIFLTNSFDSFTSHAREIISANAGILPCQSNANRTRLKWY